MGLRRRRTYSGYVEVGIARDVGDTPLAFVGVSPTSIVIGTLGCDDSTVTLGAVAAVQMTIWFPFQWNPIGITRGKPSAARAARAPPVPRWRG
jgi:hypothetical protein